MGENTHQNCTRQNKNKEDPGRQQPCWGFLFCTNLTQPTGALDSKSSKDLLESLKLLNETEHTAILMVTHDAYTASYARRVIFIKDGKVFHELLKGTEERRSFFEQIMDVISLLGGDMNYAD